MRDKPYDDNSPLIGYQYWSRHPIHTVEQWQYEVANGETRVGYWTWVRIRFQEMAENEEDQN